MSKYKVGETFIQYDSRHREECRYTLTKITDDDLELTVISSNEIFYTSSLNWLKPTFNTMITRLGFEKVKEDKGWIYYEYGNEDIVTLIIDTEDKTYHFEGWVDEEMDEALTQLMRELKADD